jgi:integrase
LAIRKRGKSAWYVTVDLGRDSTSGKRRQVRLTVRSKREAVKEEARLKLEAARGTGVEASRQTLAEYLRHWLETMRPNLAANTHKRYEALVANQIVPRLGTVQLSKLRPVQIQQLHAQLRASGRADGKGGLAPKSLLQVHRVLSEALKHAVGLQMIGYNPAQLIRAPQVRRQELATLSKQRTQQLIAKAEADDSTYGDAIIVAVHTGLRMGELLGLKWEDLDLEQGRLSVRRSLQHVHGEGFVLQPPKTPHSRRTVPLGETALQALGRQRRRQVEGRLLLGPDYPEPELVFASAVGTPVFPANLRRALERLLALAGVPRVRFHDLRHTHASLLLEQGVHPKVVSERLGHASIVITLDTYSHLLPTMQEEAAREFDAWMAAQG